MSCRAVLAAMMLSGVVAADAQVYINEIMQSNVDCVFVDHEYPDSWVELYNGGSAAVDLGGWRIGLTATAADGYALPVGTRLDAGGFLMVYCDKSDAGGYHAPFRLESGKGGAVYIFDSTGATVDAVTGIKKMPAPNVAYGRKEDGGTEWRYMLTATPGASNALTAGTKKSNSDVHPAPLFSHDSFVGVVGDEMPTVTVTLPSGASAGTLLCVTTDGREPTEADSADGGVWQLTLTGSTVVRAKLLGGDLLPVRSTVRSYLYTAEATPLRVVSLVGDPDDFYDAERGIYSGAAFSYEMTDADVARSNWSHDWRRPVNVEYFTADDHRATINQLGETRIQGGLTRRYAQKSLAVYANKRFGVKRYDTSDFWPDKPEVTSSQSFLLRNGGNMFMSTRINDALAQTLMGRNAASLDWQAYAPCIYFLNGQYMGIGDLRERSNEDYVAANYRSDAGDELEDIDMIENWNEVKAGSIDALDELQAWASGSDVTLEGLRQRVDVDNFLDQLIIHWFGGNTDFFINNIVAWRRLTGDTRWRWLLKDVDLFANTLNLTVAQQGDYYEFAESRAAAYPQRMQLFRLFYGVDAPGRDLFLDRMLVCMGDMLQPSAVKALDEAMVDEIVDEYPRHLRRYFGEEMAQTLMDDSYIGAFVGGNRYMAGDWAVARRVTLYTQLCERYGLGEAVYMKVRRGDDGAAPARVQGYALSQPTFDGQWFRGREVVVTTDEGYTIQVYADGAYQGDYGREARVVPASTSLDFIIVAAEGSGVDSVEADEADAPVEYYGIDGRRLAGPVTGIYVCRRGASVEKRVSRPR